MFDTNKYDEMTLSIYLPDNDLKFYIESISKFDGDLEELRENILHYMIDNKTSCESVEYDFFMTIIKDIDEDKGV